MKKVETVPKIPEDTLEGVRLWLESLKHHNMLFHMDDDPLDIVWGDGLLFTNDQLHMLAEEQDKALKICYEHKTDIFGLYPERWQTDDEVVANPPDDTDYKDVLFGCIEEFLDTHPRLDTSAANIRFDRKSDNVLIVRIGSKKYVVTCVEGD